MPRLERAVANADASGRSRPAAGGPCSMTAEPTTDTASASATAVAQPANPSAGPPAHRSTATARGPIRALAHSQREIQRFPTVSSLVVRTTAGSSTAPVGRSVATAPSASTAPATATGSGPSAMASAATAYPRTWAARPARRTRPGGNRLVTNEATNDPAKPAPRTASETRPVVRDPPSSNA